MSAPSSKPSSKIGKRALSDDQSDTEDTTRPHSVRVKRESPEDENSLGSISRGRVELSTNKVMALEKKLQDLEDQWKAAEAAQLQRDRLLQRAITEAANGAKQANASITETDQVRFNKLNLLANGTLANQRRTDNTIRQLSAIAAQQQEKIARLEAFSQASPSLPQSAGGHTNASLPASKTVPTLGPGRGGALAGSDSLASRNSLADWESAVRSISSGTQMWLERLENGSKTPEEFNNSLSALKVHINDIINYNANLVLKGRWPGYQPSDDKSTRPSQGSEKPGQGRSSAPSGGTLSGGSTAGPPT